MRQLNTSAKKSRQERDGEISKEVPEVSVRNCSERKCEMRTHREVYKQHITYK
jgi:hypothetical protein